MTSTIPLAQHIFRRLHQLNCHSVHGVPGDFFLRALDHIRPAGLNWIGNANELCAGYAADGYARAGGQIARQRLAAGIAEQPTVGAYITTFGVGELSGINALAGACAESVPIVQIVGTPSRKAMQNPDPTRLIHHTIPGRVMGVYSKMVYPIVCRQARLDNARDATHAAELYDEALKEALLRSKPVYVTLPSDMIDLPVPVELLETAIEAPTGSSNDELVQHIIGKLVHAKKPLLIADGLSYPLGLQSDINELISLTNIPAMSYTSAKGIIDEALPSWSPDLPNTTDYSRECDLVLNFGPIPSDTNTGRWSTIPSTENVVSFNLESVDLPAARGSEENGSVRKYFARGKDVLTNIVATLRRYNASHNQLRWALVEDNRSVLPERSAPISSSAITQDDFWPFMSTFLKPDDTLLLANGTPLIGGRTLKLPSNCQVVVSPIWNAIGSLLPAAQGIAAAKRDHHLPGRTILFEGDGSFQVTCQSISDIIRYKLDVTIFIVNNAGYTYERYLNGMKAEYNDVPSWRYVDAASFFGAKLDDPNYPAFSSRVETWGQLLEVLGEETANDGKGLKIFDVVMDPEDVPEAARPGLQRASEALSPS